MGYFRVLDELRAEAERQADEARELATTVADDHAALVEAAWARVDESGFVAKLYHQVAERDAGLELALARLSAACGEGAHSLRVLIEQGLGSTAPYLVSLLATDRKRGALQVLMQTYAGLDRPLAVLRDMAGVDSHESYFAAAILAGSPHPDDRAFVTARLADWPDKATRMFRVRLANAGDGSQDDWLVDWVNAKAEEHRSGAERAVSAGENRHLRREDSSDLVPLLAPVVARKLTAAVPALIELLASFDALEVLDTLGRLGDERALQPILDYLAALAGSPLRTAPFRIAAENAASQLGRPQPVTTARFIMAELRPRRYGYPKWDDVYQLQALAARALLLRGDDEDRRRVAALANASVAALREVGAEAFAAVHGRAPNLRYYDQPLIERNLASAGAGALLDLLGDDEVVFAENIIAALAEVDDPEVKVALTKHCRSALEAVDNFQCSYRDDVGRELAPMLRFLAELDDDDKGELLAGTSSAWIQTFIIDDSKMVGDRPQSIIGDSVTVSVRRFDGDVPFVFGNHINGCAHAADGSKLAVVGQDFCKIFAANGDFIAQLEPGWSWGYDCQFTPDSQILVTCFHGGHVESYDASTGKRLREFSGHGGVPDGVKRLALSANGEVAVSVGQDARVIAWHVASGEQLWLYQAPAGSYEAVAINPAQSKVVAAHVKTRGGQEDFLTEHDLATGKEHRFDMPSSVWAIAYSPDGNSVALGGEAGKVMICDSDFERQRELELDQTTRLAWSADGAYLYGASANGLVKRWRVAAGESAGETLLEGVGPLWALEVLADGSAIAIGTRGILHRIDRDGQCAELEGPRSHSDQVRSFAARGDAVYTSSWDGKLMRWARAGGAAEVVFEIDGRIRAGQLVGDRAILATGAGVRLVDLDDGAERCRTEGDARIDTVAVDEAGKRVAIDSGASMQLLDLDTLEPVGEPIVVGTDSVEIIRSLGGGDYLAASEAGEVSLVVDGQRQWTIADHGADRLERGNPHKSVFDLLVTGSGFISAGNDDTVRIYDWGEERQPILKKRIICDSLGIFNRLALSTDGTLLAVPGSRRLDLFAFPAGERLLSLTSLDYFENSDLSIVYFLGDELLVGTESGAIFHVGLEGVRP